MRLWAFKGLLKSSKSIARPSTKSLGDSKFQLGSFLHFLERKGPSTDVWKRTTLHLCYNNQILLIVAYTKSLQTIYTLRKHITEKNQSTSRHRGGGRTATAIEPLGLLLTKTRLCRPYVFRNDRYPKKGPYPNYEEKSSKKCRTSMMNVHNGTKFDVPIFAKIHWGVLKKKKSFKNCAPFRNGSQKGGSRESSFFPSKKLLALFLLDALLFFFLKRNKKQKGECTRVRGNKS